MYMLIVRIICMQSSDVVINISKHMNVAINIREVISASGSASARNNCSSAWTILAVAMTILIAVMSGNYYELFVSSNILWWYKISSGSFV